MTALPRVLDLFSCAGGAAMGYYRAGFLVDGCDIADRPRYPFAYHRGDALDYLAHLITTGDIERYSLVHASPPCQAAAPSPSAPTPPRAGAAPMSTW